MYFPPSIEEVRGSKNEKVRKKIVIKYSVALTHIEENFIINTISW